MAPPLTQSFDPNAAATADGIFGLPYGLDESRVVIVPAGWEPTTSSGRGTTLGPAAIEAESRQVDLFDRTLGRFYEAGIHLVPQDRRIRALNQAACKLALPIIAKGGDIGKSKALRKALESVNRAGETFNGIVHGVTKSLISKKKIVGWIGGDHSVPFGAIAAHAEAYGDLAILHLDAHADLRKAYEGFTWSHASIFRNVIERLPRVRRLVQVGIRDYGEDEHAFITASQGRIETFFDDDLARELAAGKTWISQCKRIVAAIPAELPLYLSFDIDGLDPVLCPDTGTPVPGGLSFRDVSVLLEEVATQRRIVGFDLCEVAPRKGDGGVNGRTGARLLYKMTGWTLHSQQR